MMTSRMAVKLAQTDVDAAQALSGAMNPMPSEQRRARTASVLEQYFMHLSIVENRSAECCMLEMILNCFRLICCTV